MHESCAVSAFSITPFPPIITQNLSGNNCRQVYASFNKNHSILLYLSQYFLKPAYRRMKHMKRMNDAKILGEN